MFSRDFSARKRLVREAPDTAIDRAWRIRRDAALHTARVEQLAKFQQFTAENFAEAIEFAETRYRELMKEGR